MSETAQEADGAVSVESSPYSASTSWATVLAGTALFLLLGLDLVLGEIPHGWPVPSWLLYLRGVLFLSTYILPTVGMGIGWIRGSPRRSYPYMGHVLLFSLYVMNVATPGLRIFSYTFGPNHLWGWRAWIPLLVVAVVALLVTRSLRPICNLFRSAWNDWTLITFGMLGVMPLVIAVGFDEVDRLYSLYFMVILTIVMSTAAATYLRSTRLVQRASSLFAGITLTVTVVTVAPAIYWIEHGWVHIPSAVIVGAIVVGVTCSPLLAALIRRSVESMGTA